jgi:hypothetical protein
VCGCSNVMEELVTMWAGLKLKASFSVYRRELKAVT